MSKFRNRKKAFVGAIVGAAGNIISSVIQANAQKDALEEQKAAQERQLDFQTNQYTNNLKMQSAMLKAQQKAETEKVLNQQKYYNDSALATARTNMSTMLNSNDAARNKRNSISYKYGGIKRNRCLLGLGDPDAMFEQKGLNESIVDDNYKYRQMIDNMNTTANDVISRLSNVYNSKVATRKITGNGITKVNNTNNNTNNNVNNNNSLSTTVATSNPLLLNNTFKYGGKFRKRYGLGGLVPALPLMGAAISAFSTAANTNIGNNTNNSTLNNTNNLSNTPTDFNQTPQQTVNNYTNFTNNAMDKVNSIQIGKGFRPRSAYGNLLKIWLLNNAIMK